MSIVNNVKIYDLEESLLASGYPMRTELGKEEFSDSVISRGERLSKSADWVGAHDQFLTGIRVSFDVTFSIKAWTEAERYHFLDFVSSQSTMHRIVRFDLDKQYNQYVDRRIIEIIKEKVKEYNRLSGIKLGDKDAEKRRAELLKDLYLQILYSNPVGFVLTARMTTDYRCLKNIWRQRRNHRLPEWREFCQWIETLPYAKEFLCYENPTEEKLSNAQKIVKDVRDRLIKLVQENCNNNDDNINDTDLMKYSLLKEQLLQIIAIGEKDA